MPITAATAAAAAPYVAAAIQAVGGNIASGQMNKRAARVARETNALNYQMFQEGNEFNERMFNESNAWNSPVNQRKLLEEAGYNPASMFDANIGSANPVNSSSPNAAQGFTPSVADYSQIGINAIQSFLALKQAQKVSAETENQKIKNLYEADTLQSALDLQAAQTGNLNSLTTGQEIQNEIHSDSKEWEELNIQGQAMEQIHKASIADYQQQQEEIKKNILNEYGPKKAEQEYKNLQQEYELLVAKVGTEHAQALMYQKTGDAAWLTAKTSKAVGESTINKNNAEADLARSNKRYQDMVNRTYSLFGDAKAASDFMNIVAQGKLNDAKAMEQFYKAHQKEATWRMDAMRQLVKDWLDNFNPFDGMFK